MLEMALVTLISGVCRAGRHVPHHHVADEAGQYEYGEVGEEGRRGIGADEPEQRGGNAEHDRQLVAGHRLGRRAMAVAFLGRRQRGGGRLGCRCRGGQLGRRRGPGDFALLDYRQPADRVVFHVDVDHAILGLAQFFGEAEQVGGIQRRGLLGQARIEVGVADDGHAVLHHGLARLGEFAVAAALGRHVHDHAARAHRLHHLGGDQPRCRLAGISAVVMMMSTSRACLAYISRCACWKPSLMTLA
jgi:hypothetical protein